MFSDDFKDCCTEKQWYKLDDVFHGYLVVWFYLAHCRNLDATRVSAESGCQIKRTGNELGGQFLSV